MYYRVSISVDESISDSSPGAENEVFFLKFPGTSRSGELEMILLIPEVSFGTGPRLVLRPSIVPLPRSIGWRIDLYEHTRTTRTLYCPPP